ncbi:hypothetical protein BDW02DRAFT_323592 [Decorospora gaudefroyi]|uniref:Uncharacterized protein n=1 Tax=Decorospora gaudefroyi TaxID=184978 RepID=A0A6A5KBJ7_9PLEO|nr:hypothetical protein BDW02DRAFT_323592 [Decorospora gaudefroyi]
MASKPSSPGPSATAAASTKQARSRKAAGPNQSEQRRAGSAGGVMLEKEPADEKTPKKGISTSAVDDTAASGGKGQKRKPRKLNKEPSSTPASTQNLAKTIANSKAPAETPSASELDALKSRVRGLEAKVEELYKAGAGAESRPARSPRRRGKGRKASSAAQVPTLSTTANNTNANAQEVGDDDEEEADEELVRLEGELEVARQDLESYSPRDRGTMSGDTENVEEVLRDAPGMSGSAGVDRQVTLSGSYRIPIPANVSVEDVKTIKSGVSAAQNVARSFLEQRRAAAALRARQNPPSQPAQATAPTPKPKRTTSSNLEVSVENNEGKQSWGEWIGGYSMAITRAVSKIEHEAAMESQRTTSAAVKRPNQARRISVPGTKKAGGKRPPAKATLSGEQVHGLMS